LLRFLTVFWRFSECFRCFSWSWQSVRNPSVPRRWSASGNAPDRSWYDWFEAKPLFIAVCLRRKFHHCQKCWICSKIIPKAPRSRFTCFYIFYNSINSYTLLMFRELNQIRSWMRSAHKFRFARPGQSASRWKFQWILVRDTLHIRNSGQVHWRSSSTIWMRLGPKSLFRSGQRSVFTHAACSLIAMMMTLWYLLGYLLILYVWTAQIVRKREANELPLGLRVNALEPGAVGKGQENEWCRASPGMSRVFGYLWRILACLQHRLDSVWLSRILADERRHVWWKRSQINLISKRDGQRI